MTNAPTVQQVARAILRDWGILYIDPAIPANQTNPIRSIDLDAAAFVMTAAFQEIASQSPLEYLCQPDGSYINAPTAVTLGASIGSKVVSSLTTYASWMNGCTIRISGDGGDNELVSSTSLARPYTGATGSGITATIYHDAITLDEGVEKLVGPVITGAGYPCQEISNRRDFIQQGWMNMAGSTFSNAYLSTSQSYVYAAPFWSIGPKPDAPSPRVYFLDAYYHPNQQSTVRMIRLSPMPNVAQAIGFTSKQLPQRVVAADISEGTTYSDPGVNIPCVNGWIESIFLPIARQIGTGIPTFKNDTIRGEIARHYADAIARLHCERISSAPSRTNYV